MPSGRNQPFLPFTSTFAGCCSGPGNTFTLRERIALPTTASRISGRISFSSVSFTVNVYCVTMSSWNNFSSPYSGRCRYIITYTGLYGTLSPQHLFQDLLLHVVGVLDSESAVQQHDPNGIFPYLVMGNYYI